MKRPYRIFATLWVSTLFACFTTFADSMFLKVDGIQGESVVKGHAGDIDVSYWSWGMKNTYVVSSGGGGGTSLTSITNLAIGKYLDKSSPLLMLALCKGQHIPKAELSLNRTGASGAPTEYLHITLADVVVTSFTTQSAGERPAEELSLAFSIVDVDYYPTNPDGTVGTKVHFGWDLQQNQPH